MPSWEFWHRELIGAEGMETSTIKVRNLGNHNRHLWLPEVVIRQVARSIFSPF